MLVQDEGGDAEQIIDEENGILISAMLRQYFMGLRTVGQWSHLADHWLDVANECTTPLSPSTFFSSGFNGGAPRRNIARQAVSDETSDAWRKFLQRRLGLNLKPLNDDDDSGSSDEEDDGFEPQEMDFEILLMRKFWTRWRNKVGVKCTVSDMVDDADFAVDWTRVIAPVLEGRIKITGS